MTETLTLTTEQVEVINWALLKSYGEIEDAGCDCDAPVPNVRKAIWGLVNEIADQRMEASGKF